MIKKSIVSICLLFSIGIFAQEGTASPYSFYGIGENKLKGTVDNISMGGVGVFADSTHINLQNPASYSAIKLTTLTFGGNYTFDKISTNTTSESVKRGGFDYFAVAIPMGKLATSFGLMPYSTVGYFIEDVNADKTMSRRLDGSGGLNKAYLGLSYQINSKISAGVDFSYNFGQIITKNEIYNVDAQDGTIETNKSKLFGLDFKAGLMYNTKLKNKKTLFGSLVFSPEVNLTASNQRSVAAKSLAYGTISNETTIVVPREYIKLPSKFAFGAGYGQVTKWMIGAEVTVQNSSSLSNRFSDVTTGSFENAKKISVGGYFIPKYNSFTNYLDRITYRGGFRYENTGLVVKNQSITDAALTLGLGLPMQGFSNINVGVELGQRGTKTANLIQENYVNFTISLSLNDRWFIKRKYD